MSIYAPSRDGFQSLLRIASSSVADPPWFAAPVEAAEDDQSLTVVFHAPEDVHGPVRIDASDQRVTVWGDRPGEQRRPMRLCALPCLVHPNGVETSRSGNLVRVRIPKKGPTTDSRQVSASSA
jgi:HSP20 family molecular chaperone IbpA